MSGLSDYSAQAFLNHLVGKTSIFTLPTAFVALFTAVGVDAGTGFTEVSGGSYARVTTSGATWNAASGSAPSTLTNAAAVTFATATASWGTVIAFGLYDASSAGNLLAWDYLGNFNWLPATVSAASPGVNTAKGHGYSNGDPFVFSTEYGGTGPTFSAGNYTGVQTVAGVTTDTFNVTGIFWHGIFTGLC